MGRPENRDPGVEMSTTVFDRLADRYDAWFDSERGAALFRAEVECLERLMPDDRSDWVEVGVGSGRFAAALRLPEGVDPSRALLEMAAARGITPIHGVAGKLPYGDNSLEGILLVVTLCFLDDPDRAMREFARVLRPGGWLVVGIVPADSAWGRLYMREGEQGHPFYSVARFYTTEQATEMAARHGFAFRRAASALGEDPAHAPATPQIADGPLPGWGFSAMLFELTDSAP
jgi:ubiquinone/menaquinone biosynthesis C-methylase UbiE